MKKKDNTFAFVLIIIAVYLVTKKLDLLPDYRFMPTLLTIIFLLSALKGFARLHFCEALISLAVVGWINDEALHIEALTPWTLFISCILLGLALDMIMRDKRDKISVLSNSKECSQIRTQDEICGEFVSLENSFRSATKYINSDYLREARIQNSFGQSDVFFNQMTQLANEASIRVENTFGSTNLYIPASWNVVANHNATFGNVEYRGSASNAPDAPKVTLSIESNFGETKIIYQ